MQRHREAKLRSEMHGKGTVRRSRDVQGHAEALFRVALRGQSEARRGIARVRK